MLYFSSSHRLIKEVKWSLVQIFKGKRCPKSRDCRECDSGYLFNSHHSIQGSYYCLHLPDMEMQILLRQEVKSGRVSQDDVNPNPTFVVTVRPNFCTPCSRTRSTEQALLKEEFTWSFGCLSFLLCVVM